MNDNILTQELFNDLTKKIRKYGGAPPVNLKMISKKELCRLRDKLKKI